MVRLSFWFTSLLLVGCAVAPQAPVPVEDSTPVQAPGQRPSETETAAEPRSRPDPSVALALRTQSANAAAAGDTGRAVALLERAIRIEPERADLWFDLAERYLEQGDPLRARQLVEKGASLIRDDAALEARRRALQARITAASAAGLTSPPEFS